MVMVYHGFTRAPLEATRYLLSGRELDNFTYDIGNRGELASFVSRALGCNEQEVAAYIQELDEDGQLRDSLRRRLAGRRDRNADMPFGRRLGWYAAVRTVKPTLVVETGVHDGLGSTVFLRALQRNAAEGPEGQLLSFDIRPDVGWLIPEELRVRHELVIGDSVSQLASAVGGRQVGLFLHDSDHRYEHEMAEFEAVRPLVGPGAVILSDNSHSTVALRDFSSRYGWPFSFFTEAPIAHFYPGAGIGLSRAPLSD